MLGEREKGGYTSDSVPTSRQIPHGTPGLNGSIEVAAVHTLDAHQLLSLSLLAHSLLVLIPFTKRLHPSFEGT